MHFGTDDNLQASSGVGHYRKVSCSSGDNVSPVAPVSGRVIKYFAVDVDNFSPITLHGCCVMCIELQPLPCSYFNTQTLHRVYLVTYPVGI